MNFQDAFNNITMYKKIYRTDWDSGIKYIFLDSGKIVDNNRDLYTFDYEDLISDRWKVLTIWEPKGGPWYALSEQDISVGRVNRQLADKHASRLRKFNIIAAYVDEHDDPNWYPDWSDENCINAFYVYYDLVTEKWYHSNGSSDMGRIHDDKVYMTQSVAKQLASDLNHGVVNLD